MPNARSNGFADLENQPSTRLQRNLSLWNQTLDDFEPSWSSKHRIARLELADFKLHRIFFRFAHIRRIRNHKIKSSRRKSAQQIAPMKLDSRPKFKPSRIRPSNIQRVRRNISSVDFSRRQFRSQSKRNRPRSSSDINDAQPVLRTQVRLRQLEHRLDQMLRFRTRNQHRRRHDQIEPPELLMSSDVLRRNARSAASKRFVIALRFVRSKFPLRMREQIRPIAAQRKHDKEFRIHARRRNTRRSQPLNRGMESLAKLHNPISPPRQEDCRGQIAEVNVAAGTSDQPPPLQSDL
jgi:hypothetical protein